MRAENVNVAGYAQGAAPSRAPARGLEIVWILLALSLPFIFAASSPIQGDSWWTLKTGDLILQDGRLPSHDPFSFGEESPRFVDGQWLSQVIYALSYRLAGLEGVAMLTALLDVVIFAIVLRHCARRTGSVRLAAVATLLAAMATISYFLAWAQTIGFLCFALCYWLLGRSTSNRWTLILLVAIELVWVNAHGSFFLGPALTTLFLVGRALQPRLSKSGHGIVPPVRTSFLLLASGVQALATLANPYGPAIYRYVYDISHDPIIRAFISAWQPTSVATPIGTAFFTSVALTILVVGWSSRKPTVTELLILFGFGALALQATRNIPWWILAATPIVAGHVASLPLVRFRSSRLALPGNPLSRRWSPAVIVLIGLVALSAMLSTPWTKQLNPLLPAAKQGAVSPDEPRAAAEYLARHSLSRRILAYQPWGGYLEWRLWPRYLVLVDGRIEVRPPSVWLDYQRITEGRADWRESLAREGIDLLVLDNLDQAYLISLVRASQEWHQVYQDQQATIFERVAVVPGVR